MQEDMTDSDAMLERLKMQSRYQFSNNLFLAFACVVLGACGGAWLASSVYESRLAAQQQAIAEIGQRAVELEAAIERRKADLDRLQELFAARDQAAPRRNHRFQVDPKMWWVHREEDIPAMPLVEQEQ